MAYIIEGPKPLRPGQLWTIDLWRDYTNSDTSYEFYESETKEGRDRLVQSLLERGHEFEPDIEYE